LKFLDFPIFLDSDSNDPNPQSPATREILQKTKGQGCGHGICQKAADEASF
jgi:hypothetical protein